MAQASMSFGTYMYFSANENYIYCCLFSLKTIRKQEKSLLTDEGELFSSITLQKIRKTLFHLKQTRVQTFASVTLQKVISDGTFMTFLGHN